MAGRWVAGMGQLALAVAGFTLIMVWFVKIIIPYYGMMFGESQPGPINWWIGGLGAGLFALAWFWSLVTSFSLLREASRVNLQSLKTFAAGQTKLDEAQIQAALATVPQWQRNGDVIARVFQFKDFPDAMKFVNAVAELAEQAQHHPDIDIRWNKVTLALSTHDAGGLTEKDFALARECNALSLR
jgi:4a-hydroxytetrahydrobiopterin dehydratase